MSGALAGNIVLLDLPRVSCPGRCQSFCCLSIGTGLTAGAWLTKSRPNVDVIWVDILMTRFIARNRRHEGVEEGEVMLCSGVVH